MTDFEAKANRLPVENSQFMWKLIIDLARTVDLLVAQTKPDTSEEP